MKMASLHVNTSSLDSVSTGVRLTRYVSDYFRCPIIHDAVSAKMYADAYDVLFIRYGILLFCNYRDLLFEIYKNAKRIIALEEDYTIGADYRLTKLNPSKEIWTNMPWRVKQEKGYYINWNRMTWKNGIKRKSPILKGLGYYGSYRPDREKYFEKYFTSDKYPINISSFPRNFLKFHDLNPKIHLFNPFHDRRQINVFQCVLYLEDIFTHENYNSPANRFYECLCLGVPLLFDKSCIGTFKKAGFVIDPFVVDSPEDVYRLLKCTDEISRLQREQWYKDYYVDLNKDFDRIVKKSIGGNYVLQDTHPYI